MMLVDSSVWIDFLRHVPTRQVERLKQGINVGEIVLGDLILCEVLQGVRNDTEFERLTLEFKEYDVIELAGAGMAVAAARNYRKLRARGITIRRTIDTLIATRCILDRLPLLYSDRDFDPFVEHLGLVSALDLPGVS